jgi:hypothetical protein
MYAKWPGLYQGVLDEIDLQSVGRDEREIGTFHVRAELGTVTRAFLLLRYETAIVAVQGASQHRPDVVSSTVDSLESGARVLRP